MGLAPNLVPRAIAFALGSFCLGTVLLATTLLTGLVFWRITRRRLPWFGASDVAWLGAAIGGELVRHTRRFGLPALGPIAMWALSLLFTTEVRRLALLQGAAMLAGTLLLATFATHLRQPPAEETSPVPGRVRRMAMALAVAMFAGTVVVAPLLGPRMPLADANERFDLRRYQEPPFDPLAIPSPLVQVKAQLKDERKDEVMFTVTSDVEIDRFPVAKRKRDEADWPWVQSFMTHAPANLAALAMFGYSGDEVVGRPVAELIIPPHLREAHAMGFRRFRETRKSRLAGRVFETEAMRHDGSVFPVELSFSHVEIEGRLVSRPYVDMTLEVMRRFGARASPDPPSGGAVRFSVPPGQAYRPADLTIEGDYSSAAFFFAAAAIVPGRVEVGGLDPRSLQGDARFLDLLEEMGCAVDRGTGARFSLPIDLTRPGWLLSCPIGSARPGGRFYDTREFHGAGFSHGQRQTTQGARGAADAPGPLPA